MFHHQSHCLRLRALLYLNTLSPQTLKCHHLLLQPLHPSLFSTTSDSDQNSFTVSYLTNNCGFSPQAALKASNRVNFNTPQKPNSVTTFFKNHGFSNSQIYSIILREPELFVSNPIKIKPKFEFLASKGASPSDIVAAATRSPRFLRVSSLENHIIPAFELVRSFCPSDEKAIASIIVCPTSISDPRLKPNIQFLLDVGVPPPSIYHLLRTRPSIICSNDLKDAVEEIKELGFDTSKHIFCVALLTKRAVTKSQWDAKVDALKARGFSQDAIFKAFRKHPNFMLRSPDKLNAVTSFWIDKLGWDPSWLMEAPILFGYSLEKRFIPRASVVQYLLSKGLIKKDSNLATPFRLTDELFLRRYVKRFEEETSRLLKLYQGYSA